MPDKTTLQEVSQALFCSVADKLGISVSKRELNKGKYETYEKFLELKKNSKLVEDSFKRVEAPNVSLKQIEDFLTTNNDWYISSINIALELLKQLSSISSKFGEAQSNFQNLYYFRGDLDIMGNISKLFTKANKNTDWAKLTKQPAFGNINKWNPADIYLGSKKAKIEIKKELNEVKDNYFFTDLNNLINRLIDSGDLLPLSLKKATKTVHIVKVNFDSSYKRKLLSAVKFVEFSPWKRYKSSGWDYKKNKPKEKTESRDLRIKIIAEKNQIALKIRHDPAAGTGSGSHPGAFKVEVEGTGEARGGSIGSFFTFCRILSFIDKPFSKEILDIKKRAFKKFTREMEKRKYFKGQSGREKLEKKSKKAFNYFRGEVSALFVLNNVMSKLSGWLKRLNQKEKNKFARLCFEYITSRSKMSGKFVIAK